MNAGVYSQRVQFNDSQIWMAKLGATKFYHELGNGKCTGWNLLSYSQQHHYMPGLQGWVPGEVLLRYGPKLRETGNRWDER